MGDLAPSTERIILSGIRGSQICSSTLGITHVFLGDAMGKCALMLGGVSAATAFVAIGDCVGSRLRAMAVRIIVSVVATVVGAGIVVVVTGVIVIAGSIVVVSVAVAAFGVVVVAPVRRREGRAHF